MLSLCADDYGLGAGVDAGILQLAAAGRLTEVSCMTNLPGWRSDAPILAALPAVVRGDVRLGLHFNLTEGLPVSAALARHWPRLPSLPRLLALAHLRRLPGAALREELQAQLAAFEGAAGRTPAHLDGHQHVHHLPLVRDLVLEQVQARPALRVRDSGHLVGPGFAFKRQVIERSGGRTLSRRLHALGRQANTVLLGVYDFGATPYRDLMQAWLAALPDRGGLIFCHPGRADTDANDAIAAARVRELAYLAGSDFSADLSAAGVRLGSAG